MITTLTPIRLSASVMAVPPLCRNADLSLSERENARLIRATSKAAASALSFTAATPISITFR